MYSCVHKMVYFCSLAPCQFFFNVPRCLNSEKKEKELLSVMYNNIKCVVKFLQLITCKLFLVKKKNSKLNMCFHGIQCDHVWS